jgi:hypothetical protein
MCPKFSKSLIVVEGKTSGSSCNEIKERKSKNLVASINYRDRAIEKVKVRLKR